MSLVNESQILEGGFMKGQRYMCIPNSDIKMLRKRTGAESQTHTHMHAHFLFYIATHHHALHTVHIEPFNSMAFLRDVFGQSTATANTQRSTTHIGYIL